MSSDNILLITGKGPFLAYDCWNDGKEHLKEKDSIFEADTLEDAIKKAELYCKENIVEYNYRFMDFGNS